MYPRSFSSSNRGKSHLEAPPLPLLNGGLLFSFSKSLKGSRVNLFPGEEGREGWERRQFRNNKRGCWVGKRLAHGALYRDVDRKFLAPIPLSMRDARELSNPKDFRSVAPLSASSRYVEFQFGSSRLATPSSRSSLSPFFLAEKSFSNVFSFPISDSPR